MKNYTVLHLHTQLGNGGFIDSTATYSEYIDRAKELGMTAIAFTEHGSVFGWYRKKKYAEESGLKYIHASEFYITETLSEKIRDNYHACLYARNFDGFKELNKLSSISYKRSQENRFYYNPRITFEELINTSDNILITSACVGGILGKGNAEIKQRFITFMQNNKHRCFLEIQPFGVDKQIEHNQYMYKIHTETGIRLTCGTDTHALDEMESREILQKSKKIFFEDERGWNLTFKNYEQLVKDFEVHRSIPTPVILEAIENTNVISSMVEPFELDYSNKYPHIYDNPEKILIERIKEGAKERGIDVAEYRDRINYEFATYKKNGALQFLLLEDKIKTYCRENDIAYGYSRGSVSGSFIAYLLKITDVNSIKWNLSFERFMSPERVSLSDIDTDYAPSQRELVKDFLYEKSGINCCDIVTYNTIALKGAIRDVARALDIDLLTVGEICDNVETNKEKYVKKFPELFRFVNKLEGTITSAGSHPCGTVLFDGNIEEMIGTFTTSSSKYPVTQISMKEVDEQNYVKLDILGLDNVELIQKTCKLANIPWVKTDNIDFNDKDVWDSILKSSCMVFQWESSFAHSLYKKLFCRETLDKIQSVNPNMTFIDLFSMGNGALRPAGESYRDRLCNGEFNDNGHPALNEFLSPTSGFLVYQEQVIEFLNKFCGFTMGEADVVRRGFAKKTGTEQFLPRIKEGFIKTMNEKYGEDEKLYESLIESFLEVINNASAYLFSLNHSVVYSFIGYICAWLRYYYPLEFIASALEIYKDKEEKTTEIVEYARLIGVKINPIKFRFSKAEYFMDKETNSIYKGVGSVKYLNDWVPNELYNLRGKKYSHFVDLLLDIENTSTNSQQLNILIELDFFSEFGNSRELARITDIFRFFKNGFAKSIKKELVQDDVMLGIIKKHSVGTTKGGAESKSWMITDCRGILVEYEKHIRGIEMKDYDIKKKISSQLSYLGYVSTTNKDEDRSTLIVYDVKTVARKKDNKVFGCGVVAMSLGSGIKTRYTAFNRTLDMCGQLKTGDIIKCTGFKKDGEYWELTSYTIL